MNENIRKQIAAEIALKRSELKALETAFTALGGVNGTKPAPAAGKPVAAKDRAPDGALESAMLGAIEAKPGMTTAELVKKLRGGGYKWSLSPLYVGKRLTKLADKKKVEIKMDKHLRRFHPAK
jgi:hypothetical protein